MPDITINGVVVNFPKDPYECQVKYMEANIRAISTGTNALLESPTGTGKTLCLLCSTLAWHGQNVKAVKPLGSSLAYSSQASITNFMSNSANVGSGPSLQVGLIIYASRTHSQISQVVSELKSTVYRPKMTVLGSRDQLCIHEKVSKLKGGALNHACSVLSSKRGCTYKNNLDSYAGPMDSFANPKDAASLSRPMLDIEELVSVGRKDRICPYFYSRDASSHSEMVLLPYNYLLDSSIRRTLKISWQDAIVIFDEGHNLERVASDAASFVLTSTEIAECIQNLQAGLAILHEEAQAQKLAKKNAEDPAASTSLNSKSSAAVVDSDSTVQRPRLKAIVEILTGVFALEAAVAGLPLTSTGMIPNTVSTVLPGRYLRDLFIQCGILHHHAEELRKCANMLMEAAEDSMNSQREEGGGGGGVSMSITVPKIMDLASAVDRVHSGARGGQLDEYRVYICEEEVRQPVRERSSFGSVGGGSPAVKGGQPYHRGNYHGAGASGSSSGGGGGSGVGGGGGFVMVKRRVIHYWCFSPGIAMEELKALGVRSVILTSGTLSPMSALREDMKLPFPVQLENPHVIGGNQMWVGALSVGPRGNKLNSAFNNRDSSEYKDELGWSILQICLAMTGKGSYGLSMPNTAAIPQGPELRGGILVFYPSYSAMEGFIQHWEKSGMLDKMRNIVGAIVVEPRGSGKTATTEGKTSNSNSGSGGGGGSGGFVTDSQRWGDGSSLRNSNNFMTSHIKKVPTTASPDVVADVEDPSVRGVIGEFESAMQRFGGCLLMAVCRGKVSEGIDFTDNKGRCVIITGIPFAPFMDPWVILKKDYLDGRVKKALEAGGSSSSGTSGSVSINPYSGKSYGAGVVVKSEQQQVKIEPLVKAEPLTNPYSNPGGLQLVVKSEVKTEPQSCSRNMWSSAASNSSGAPHQHSTGYYGTTSIVEAASGAGALVKSSSTNSLTSIASTGSGGGVATTTTSTTTAGAAVKGVSGLTGQNWYNQSASRAINQCLGRVIRHRKDWGAVFLLDDRFQNQAQSNQLSSWVRPSFKKFQSFNAALHQFRGFISTAMNDSNLRLGGSQQQIAAAESAPSMPLMVHVNPRVSINVSKEQREDGDAGTEEYPRRIVTIDENALDRDSVSNFIDPEFLMTQQPVGGDVGTKTLASNSSAPTEFKKKAPQPTSNGLSSIISSLKNKPQTASAAVPVPVARFGLSAAKKDFEFAPPVKVVDLTADENDNSGNGSSRTEPPEDESSSLSHSVQSTQVSSSQVALSQSKSKPKFGLMSQSNVPSVMSVLPSQSVFSASDSVKSILSNLKKLLPESSYNEFKRIIIEHRPKTGRTLGQISQIKGLMDKLEPVFSSLSVELKRNCLMALSVLVDGNLQSSFVALVNQSCVSAAVKIKSEVKLEQSSQSSGSSSGGFLKSKQLAASAHCYGQIGNEDVLNHSSKRAKIMLSASQSERAGGSSATAALLASVHNTNSSSSSNSGSNTSGSSSSAKRPDFLSQLKSIDKMELSFPTTGQTKVSAGNRGSLTEKRLQCIMCQETATDAAAARCGHIACEVCWKHWLKVNQSCPLCRKTASASTITRVIVKKS